jgi:sulfur carrier protein
MTVYVNGVATDIPDGTTVFDLVDRSYGVRRGVAVAIGGEVVPRSTWDGHVLRSADEIEILVAVQGG